MTSQFIPLRNPTLIKNGFGDMILSNLASLGIQESLWTVSKKWEFIIFDNYSEFRDLQDEIRTTPRKTKGIWGL